MASEKQATPKGLKFRRKYTNEDVNVFDQFEYDYRTSIIRNPSGEVVFEMNNVEVPKQWSQIATDILAQKYFVKLVCLSLMVLQAEKLLPNKWLIVWLIAGECGENAMDILQFRERCTGFLRRTGVFYFKPDVCS
jgi:hypothetical protein